MRYKLLGKSGLRVSELCLGTMTFGETWGWGASLEESRAMLDAYEQVGGNFIDTSVNYTDGASETYLGELLQGRRDRFVLASKYTLTRPDDTDPNGGGNSRKNMMRSVERSLKRLRTEALDLYYLHVWDGMTPIDEVLRGLDDLVSQGKVQYIAVSDSPDWIVAQANTLTELRGWAQFVGYQVPYSLLERDIERSIIPMAHHWDMTVLPWGLLRGGILTGKFLEKVADPTRINPERLKLSEKELSVVREVQNIAAEEGRSASQVAINWVRQNAQVQMIPIIGARSVRQLQDNLGALEWSLSLPQIQRLDDLSRIDLGFPHGFMEGNPYVFGATFDKIDNHHR